LPLLGRSDATRRISDMTVGREPRHEADSMMTRTDPDIAEQNRSAQMADALIAHLGTVAAALQVADRQRRAAEGAARATWDAILLYIEQRRDHPETKAGN
jgi:hypothetical protein